MTRNCNVNFTGWHFEQSLFLLHHVNQTSDWQKFLRSFKLKISWNLSFRLIYETYVVYLPYYYVSSFSELSSLKKYPLILQNRQSNNPRSVHCAAPSNMALRTALYNTFWLSQFMSSQVKTCCVSGQRHLLVWNYEKWIYLAITYERFVLKIFKVVRLHWGCHAKSNDKQFSNIGHFGCCTLCTRYWPSAQCPKGAWEVSNQCHLVLK